MLISEDDFKMKDDMTYSKNDKILSGIVQILILFFLFVFFTRVCPLVIFDADDWTYFSQPRIPLPLWHGWNPTRILPEVAPPLVGFFSANVIYPIIGDYVEAITIGAAGFISLFIMVLCMCVKSVLCERLNMTNRISLCYEVLFLTACFAIFRHCGTSKYLFFAANLNCTFVYTLSGIVNAITILIMMRYKRFIQCYKTWTTCKKGLFVILVYYSICSNLFQSGMIMIYSFICVIYDYVQMSKKNKKTIFAEFVFKENIFLGIIIGWIVAFIFELAGGRADRVNDGKFQFIAVLKQLKSILGAIAKPFALISSILFAWVIIKALYDHYHDTTMQNECRKVIGVLLINMILLTIYLLILCSRVLYFSRIEASWGIWFYLILIDVVSFAYLMQTYSKLKVFLPIIIMSVLFSTAYPDGRFMISTVGQVSYYNCVKQDNDIINAIIAADRNDLDNATVTIKDYSDDCCSPLLSGGLGQSVSNALYNHGLISRKIKVITLIAE